MERRAFIVTAAGGLLSAPFAAEAPAAKVPRIGFLAPTSSPSDAGRLAAFREGLRELGSVEGQNIAIESRSADGNYDRLPGLAAEPVRPKMDLLAPYGTRAAQAAKRA